MQALAITRSGQRSGDSNRAGGTQRPLALEVERQDQPRIAREQVQQPQVGLALAAEDQVAQPGREEAAAARTRPRSPRRPTAAAAGNACRSAKIGALWSPCFRIASRSAM